MLEHVQGLATVVVAVVNVAVVNVDGADGFGSADGGLAAGS